MGFPRLLEVEVGNAHVAVQFGFQFDSSGDPAQCVDLQAKKPEACGKLKYMLPLRKCLDHSPLAKVESLKLQLGKSKQMIPICSLFGWTKHSQQTEFRTWDCPFRAQLAKGIVHSIWLARGTPIAHGSANHSTTKPRCLPLSSEE